MVADSEYRRYRLSQELAVAVKQRKYRWTAVPAKRANPLERWSQEPRVGKIRAAKTLEEKDNRNGLGFSLA